MPLTLKFEVHCQTNFTLHSFLQFFIEYLQTLNIACINNLYKPLNWSIKKPCKSLFILLLCCVLHFVDDRSTALHFGVDSHIVG